MKALILGFIFGAVLSLLPAAFVYSKLAGLEHRLDDVAAVNDANWGELLRIERAGF